MRKDFVANVSHELKTPLSAIQGFAETLMEGALDDRKEAEKFIEIIHNHSARLHRLVEDIMTLSRIELGEIRFHLQPMNIQRGIENSVALVSRRTELQKIKLSVEMAPALPLAHADPDRITQVMVNILDNAVKFTPEGGSIRVSTRIAECGVRSAEFQSEIRNPKSTIEITVEDTGPGIPPLLIPRLGERFYRVDPARSRDLGGTGLGLAIVKHILQAHGSSLSIKNAQRHGTIVSFCLPIDREETVDDHSSSAKL